MKPARALLDGALVLSTPQFGDDRGWFRVAYEERAAAEVGLPSHFVQDNWSYSAQAGTLRGIHLQLPPHEQGKLVRVVRGSIVDVIVDLRSGSASRGQHEAVELRADSGDQLWVPRGFGHAFYTLEADTEVYYKVDNAYAPSAERTLAWDDPALGIEWPVGGQGPVLSAKDAEGASLAEIVSAIDAARMGEAEGALQ